VTRAVAVLRFSLCSLIIAFNDHAQAFIGIPRTTYHATKHLRTRYQSSYLILEV